MVLPVASNIVASLGMLTDVPISTILSSLIKRVAFSTLLVGEV